ncbi:hypothetical protein [Longimicrobium terrae]|uniref:Uncharacterized protein n=1 Tax=Longimicrobium terrae TaxID=1639882 RepID=A0A841GUG1_9BACT|nr:hypothetical protein [Longimicrobium terrae]MBB4636013.1 hypothetical protein [Longimicrobium terrae]MBB6070409.1 hypothetical protein [Longimicrobium terrae]NNC30903.1 hypothetical protein [Longimicrobium terrae]
MRDVAAPLYRFFLSDAQTAAREGDTARMLECLGLALDFAPDEQKERVLLAAADLAPPATSPNGDRMAPPAHEDPAQALVVRIAGTGGGAAPLRRITWEPRSPAVPAASSQAGSWQSGVGDAAAPVRARARPSTWFVTAAAAGALLLTGAARFDWSHVALLDAVRGDPIHRAERALAAGNADLALHVLEPLGEDATARAWLVRSSAYIARADTAAAVDALATAATRDQEGGCWALSAGDRLGRIGKTNHAADAYLYAVTSARTPAELERIAEMQERAGHSARARRIRAR